MPAVVKYKNLKLLGP